MASEAERIAGTLTEAQRGSLLSFSVEPRQMGIGMMQHLPSMVAPDGLNHPNFGPHYRLTPLGLEVKRILEEKE